MQSLPAHPGGTIGLCTGLSLISVVETVYWLCVWLRGRGKALMDSGPAAEKKKNLEEADKPTWAEDSY